MEIDLNHAVSEVEKNACDTEGEVDKLGQCCNYFLKCLLPYTSSSTSSNAVFGCSTEQSKSSIFMELWHACAGPLIDLPKKGNVVVYFPQGHAEQAGSASTFQLMDIPTFDLPPQILCRVVDVQLMASKENDELYTQLTLLPLSESTGVKLDGKEIEITCLHDDVNGVLPTKSTSHMFCKTLTASDTSTHGGFSVPRRAAEDCFPPLNYKEQRPSQELIAKDIHGVEWKFRHIYRGQPRRHLLTTGWSIFVSQKNLVSGDAVLFLRGESGELRLGIRRAARPRNGLPDSVIKNHNSYPNVLSPVAKALSSKTTFSIYYSPRANHADFIVPYKKYVTCLTSRIHAGMRFRMRYDLDDTPERRFSGVVTGVGDVDPYKWPNSKWRCLMVRWDEDALINIQERVSPWDIDLSGHYTSLNMQSSPKMKKLRSSLHVPSNGSPIIGSAAVLDFEESMNSSKVLQGQENVGLVSNLRKTIHINHLLGSNMQPNPIPKMSEKIVYGDFVRRSHHAPATFAGFVEPTWFPKVLQGQEICSLKTLSGKNDLNLSSWSKPEHGFDIYNRYQKPSPPGFYPLASEGARNVSFPLKDVFGSGQSPSILSSFSNFQAANKSVTSPSSILNGATVDGNRMPSLTSESPRMTEKASTPAASITNFKAINDACNTKESVPTFKIFGFSLSEDPATLNLGKRSCTKVHKQGSLVGRAIDLSALHSYNDLMNELEKLFNMEGLLSDPKNGWRILYTDSENDMMVVGDDPWHEFIDVVAKIHIYTQEEVEKLTVGINSDDAKSCLEEAAHATADVSKSSSVGQPDSSSPTIVRM